MPLVQRNLASGQLFRQDAEPTDWRDADLWADTNSTPRALFINDDGTAVELGTFNIDSTVLDESSQTSADALESFTLEFNHATSFGTRASITLTPTSANNLIILYAMAVMRGRGGSQTWTQEISEGGVERITAVTSTFDTIAATLILTINGTLSDEAAEASTYDLRTKSSSANQIALGDCSIFGVVAT